MAKTRLCIVTNIYLPQVGGIQTVVYEQTRRLRNRNYDPFVVTNRINTPKSYVVEGINVDCYESINTGYRLGIPYTIPSVASLETFIKAIQSSDIIHAHGHPYLTSLIAGKLAKRYNKPFVLTQHNTFIDYDNMFDTVERVNDLAVGKASLKLADKITVVSNATKKYVLSLGADPNKVKVIHNGVDLEYFRPIEGKREEMRKKLGISQNAVVVLTVRRIVYKNGIDTLIDAAEIAVKKNPNITFLIVGIGPNKESAEERIKQLGIDKNVIFAGFASTEELPFYYNAADFFVVPSKSGEGLPLVAEEALSCGLPVIATDVGGVGEIVTEKYGTLIPPNMPEPMAKTILEYAKMDLSKRRLEVRAMMEEQHSWEKNVDSLVKIYEELI
jgi:glycosyltransferase involved in cell wall biosynthesis